MKKIALICSIIASITILSGCGAKEQKNVEDLGKTPVVESNSENNKENSSEESTSNKSDENKEQTTATEKNDSTEKGNTTDSIKESKKETEFKVYYYDVEEDKLKTDDVKAEKVDGDLILAKLKEKKVLTEDVKINSIDKKEKVAIIDFNSAFINKNLGSGVESNFLDCTAKTFIDGLGLDKLKITVDGKAYLSGHIQLEDDYYFKK